MVVLITTRQNSLLYNTQTVSILPQKFTYIIYRYFDLRIRYDGNVCTDAFGYYACESYIVEIESHTTSCYLYNKRHTHISTPLCACGPLCAYDFRNTISYVRRTLRIHADTLWSWYYKHNIKEGSTTTPITITIKLQQHKLRFFFWNNIFRFLMCVKSLPLYCE